MKNHIVSALALAALWAAITPAARADIIETTNNRRMKGIVLDEVEGSTSINFMTSRGRMTIPRARIKSIIREPLAQGLVHIGDEYFDREDFDAAMAEYKKAKAEDPEFKAADERIERAEEAIEMRTSNQRRDDISKIDEHLNAVREKIRLQRFEEAEKMIKASDTLSPTTRQKSQIRKLTGELYLAWARERLDKFNKSAAEAKLDEALAADPDNAEVMELLLKLWEDDPEKREQTLRVYQTALDASPEDTAVRRKVADLNYLLGHYEDAVYHYGKIYESSPRYKNTSLEGRLLTTLERLHQRYARKKDYEGAVFFFNMQAEIDPKADRTQLAYYQYLEKAEGVAGDDVAGLLGLGQFADTSGLESIALEKYRRVLELQPGEEIAMAALNRRAMDLIGEAQTYLNRNDYHLAKTLAIQAATDYPESAEAELRKEEIVGRANQEIIRDQREKRQRATDYVRNGDDFFQQAEGYYRDMSDRQIDRRGTVYTSKRDADRYYRIALANYQTALQLDPSLGEGVNSPVKFKLQICRERLRILTSPPPNIGTQNSNRPIRRR